MEGGRQEFFVCQSVLAFIIIQSWAVIVEVYFDLRVLNSLMYEIARGQQPQTIKHTDSLPISIEKYSSLLIAQAFNNYDFFLPNSIIVLSIQNCYYIWIWKPDVFFSKIRCRSNISYWPAVQYIGFNKILFIR